jgi:AP2 domain
MKYINMGEERIGEISKNKYGSKMVIVQYNSAKDILVKFEKGNVVHTRYKPFLKGEVKNPYDKSVYGIGYIGEGKYKPTVHREMTPQYKVWRGMLQRCYDKKFQENNMSYLGCIVNDEWHNFQTFAEWYDQNFYEIEGERVHLDKDVLIKGNKVYSPNTCIFVPHRINSLFTKSNSIRGDLPIGVSKDRRTHRYVSTYWNRKQDYIGMYNTPEEAFEAYKTHKEKYIKETAEQYKDKIPVKLYMSMLKYEVKITD